MTKKGAFLSLVTLLGLSSSAWAGGGYISAGIGPGAKLSGDAADHFDTEKNNSARVSIGQRIDDFALEVSMFGTGMKGHGAFVTSREYSTLSLGVDLKYYLGIAGPLEAYIKAGLNKTWLQAPDLPIEHDYQGTGWDIGAGLQYTFSIATKSAGIWLDLTRQDTELRDGAKRSLDGVFTTVNLGLTIGF